MHPVVRTLHDLGLAAWTGGALMGAVGLNGAAATLADPTERSRVSTAGWTRWAPVSAAGLAAHLVGATGLLVTDWPRVRSQRGVVASSAAKTAVTAAAVGVAAWSGLLNRRMAAAGPVPVQGATEPAATTPPAVAAAQRRLRVVQWLNPLAGFAVLAVGSWQSEQQRAAQEVRGRVQRALGSSSAPAALAAGAASVAVGVLAAGVLAARSRTPAPAAAGFARVEVAVAPVDVIDLDTALGDSDNSGVELTEPFGHGSA